MSFPSVHVGPCQMYHVGSDGDDAHQPHIYTSPKVRLWTMDSLMSLLWQYIDFLAAIPRQPLRGNVELFQTVRWR